MANNIDLTISALECPLGTFQCSGRLIFRLRTETFFQKVPVFCMAYSAPTAHCAVSSETLMLQPLRGLRTPHRSIVSSPLAAAAALWLPCVRGAVRRRAGLRGCRRVGDKGEGGSPSPVCAPNQLFKLLRCFAWLIHDFAPSPMRALVFRSAYSASRNARASAAFAASIKAHCAVSSETLMLQVRCANPPMPHRTSSLSCSGVPVGLLS